MVDETQFEGAIKLKSLSARNKRMLSDEEKAFLNTSTSDKPDEVNTQEESAELCFVESTTLQPVISHVKVDEEVIVIKDNKKRVTISYTHDDVSGKTLTFSVSVPAASVEIQKNGVSILISKNIEISPPTLTPCTLETEDTKFSVIFAGATHTLGNYVNMPFIIVE